MIGNFAFRGGKENIDILWLMPSFKICQTKSRSQVDFKTLWPRSLKAWTNLGKARGGEKPGGLAKMIFQSYPGFDSQWSQNPDQVYNKKSLLIEKG